MVRIQISSLLNIIEYRIKLNIENLNITKQELFREVDVISAREKPLMQIR